MAVFSLSTRTVAGTPSTIQQSVGLLIGRSVVRGLVRALLPPRLRSSLALLWTANNLTPPRPAPPR